MKEGFDLTGKVIAITGGGGVLCGTMARALAGEEAKIAVWDLNEEAAVKVADEIKSSGGVAVVVQCDVLDKASLQAVNDKTVSERGV